jgi:probable rRNA maturation factor
LELVLNLDVATEYEPDVDAAFLESILSGALAGEGFHGSFELSVVITDDAELHELNRQYRGIDAPTDVLSFSQMEGESEASAFPTGDVRQLGDVVISGDRVRAQAQEYGHSRRRELAYLAVHGLLHLIGYDHESADERAKMRAAEEKALESCPR